MSETIQKVLKNKTPYSSSDYKFMKTRSDGRLPDRTKPASKGDKVIHNGHIVDSGQYNLRHLHDHGDELAFDFERLYKDSPKEAARLHNQLLAIMNPIFKRMKVKLVETK